MHLWHSLFCLAPVTFIWTLNLTKSMIAFLDEPKSKEYSAKVRSMSASTVSVIGPPRSRTPDFGVGDVIGSHLPSAHAGKRDALDKGFLRQQIDHKHGEQCDH